MRQYTKENENWNWQWFHKEDNGWRNRKAVVEVAEGSWEWK